MLAWRAATTIMVVVTIVTVIIRILGLNPFTDIFDLFIVYLPTSILLGTIVFRRLRGSSDQTGYVIGDQSAPENKAV
jgi:hypothetical protein